MQKAIEYLQECRKQKVEHLKNKENEYLTELQELDKAINWLRKIDELNLRGVQKYDLLELPDIKTGFSEFRILNDCETDDRNLWIELKKDDYPVFMTAGDILIIGKP